MLVIKGKGKVILKFHSNKANKKKSYSKNSKMGLFLFLKIDQIRNLVWNKLGL